MTANHADLYKLAEYYDIAFDFRDVGAECDFLAGLLRRHGRREPAAVLELAAGPAQHALEFARRGVRSVALDLAQHMVDYAQDRARREGVALECVRGDMTGFALLGRFDLVLLLMDSCSYLLDNDAVLRNFECVAEHLEDGGLYVLEMGHPRDVFRVGASARTSWRAQRGDTTVDMEWGRPDDVFDPTSQVTQVTVTVRYDGPDGSGTLTDRAPERCFTANELRALVAASGRFEIVEMLGAMSAAVPFSNEKASWRMVPVLRKRA